MLSLSLRELKLTLASPLSMQTVFKADLTDLTVLMDEIAAEKKKLLVPLASGSSIVVRLEDPQVPSITFQPLVGVQSMCQLVCYTSSVS